MYTCIYIYIYICVYKCSEENSSEVVFFIKQYSYLLLSMSYSNRTILLGNQL